MIKLTNKDADFLAGIFRKYLNQENISYEKSCTAYEGIQILTNRVHDKISENKELEKKYFQILKDKRDIDEMHEKQILILEKAITLCMEGSNEIS